MKRTLTRRVAPKKKNQIPALRIPTPKTSLERSNPLLLFSPESVGDFVARHGLGDSRCREEYFHPGLQLYMTPSTFLIGKRKRGKGLLALFIAYIFMHA
jgi:hypothetical protein